MFENVARLWYRARVMEMFDGKPACPALNTVNHLLGMCPVCKAGRFKNKIQDIVIDRLYVMKSPSEEDIDALRMLIRMGYNIRTNLEFPLPRVEVGRYVHIPMFYDTSLKLAIDVFEAPLNRNKKALIKAIETELALANIGYLVLSKTKVPLYKSRGLIEHELKAMQLVAAFKSGGLIHG